MWFDTLLAYHLIPDLFVRIGLWMHFTRRRTQDPFGIETRSAKMRKYLSMLRQQPIALSTDKANEQHYEVPTEFFDIVLGPRKKYSCCWFPKLRLSKKNLVDQLPKAEEKMLEITAARASIDDGDRVLDVGCGWGSFSLFAAERFPNSKITAISNSATQKQYIDRIAREKHLKNINVITANIVDFEFDERDERFDRIVSIEMFEHMRNYEKLMQKMADFLTHDGTLFIHIFARVGMPYLMKVKKTSGFISKYFFTGGMMPSEDLLLHFQQDLALQDMWRINGMHYYRTLMAWLKKMRMNKNKVKKLFQDAYGKGEGTKWYNYWKIFFISCAEMFRYALGNRWFIAHYLFKKR